MLVALSPSGSRASSIARSCIHLGALLPCPADDLAAPVGAQSVTVLMTIISRYKKPFTQGRFLL